MEERAKKRQDYFQEKHERREARLELARQQEERMFASRTRTLAEREKRIQKEREVRLGTICCAELRRLVNTGASSFTESL